MPTRPNHCFEFTSHTHAKRRRLRRLITGLAAGMALSMPGAAIADGNLQLSAPSNAPSTIDGASGEWTKRAATNTMPADTTPVESNRSVAAPVQPAPTAPQPAGTTNSAPKPISAIQATPAAAPLDRFRSPLTKLPSMKLGAPAVTPPSETTPQVADTPTEPSTAPADSAFKRRETVPTPGDAILDRQATPAPATTNVWLGRGNPSRETGSRAAVSTASDPAPDDFRSPAVEGNWVARDAINLNVPLRDPVPEPVAVTKQPTSPATPDAADVDEATDQQDAPVPNRGTATKATSPIEVAPNAVSGDGFSKRSSSGPKSMSLDEAEAAVNTTDDIDPTDDPDDTTELTKLPAEGKATELLAPQTEVSPESADEERSTTSDDNQADRPRTDEADVASTETQESTATKELPKRKPLSNLADARVSSVKKKTAKPEPEKDNVHQAEESASVGDLEPTEEQVLDYTGHPALEIRPTRTVAGMRRGIERTLSYFYNRPEVATGRSNWGMMHSLMVFGADTQIAVGRQQYSAIAWIAGNNNCRGQRLLTQDSGGIKAKSGVGLQGHQGQFLAILGMCNVPTNYPLHAGKMKYDVAALIEAEKKACKVGEELTFTLIALSHYLDTDSTWIAEDGSRWDFERLIAEELKQPIIGAACGGTHRLMGYTHALRKRRAEGKPITGHWKRAETYTQDFINYAYSIQNRDGSMSTDWFEGRADNGDVDRKIQTTGHIVEWLLTVTPDEELQDRRLVAAVSFLLRSVGSDLDRDWSIGPKGHALRSLAMYHQRVFRAGTPWIPSSIARSHQTSDRR